MSKGGRILFRQLYLKRSPTERARAVKQELNVFAEAARVAIVRGCGVAKGLQQGTCGNDVAGQFGDLFGPRTDPTAGLGQIIDEQVGAKGLLGSEEGDVCVYEGVLKVDLNSFDAKDAGHYLASTALTAENDNLFSVATGAPGELSAPHGTVRLLC